MGRADLVYCAHINLLPLAALAAKMLRAPLVLAAYGNDVWTPAGRLPPWLVAREIAYVISISQLTIDRFRAWCPIPAERFFLVPNAITLGDYGQKPKSNALLKRLGLEGKTVLLTDSIQRPNGIALSPDEKVLYVGSSDDTHPRWYAFHLDTAGNIHDGGILQDIHVPQRQLRGIQRQ